MDRSTLKTLLDRAGLKKVRGTGEGFQAVCPFHVSSSGQAGWKINADTGLWLCHKPQCAQKGNIVDFLVRLLQMPLGEALKYSAAMPRVATLGEDDWSLPPYEQRFEQHQEFKPERLLGLYNHCPRYMLERGFDKDFLQEFEIGFDGDSGRVTFPVRSPEGRLMGFTRRSTNPVDTKYKYLHDVDREQTLYLIERVKPGSPIGVTEGSVDALRARQRARQARIEWQSWELILAVHNMVATLGSKMSEAQAVMIARLYPSVVYLGFDLWLPDPQSGEPMIDVVDATCATFLDIRR